MQLPETVILTGASGFIGQHVSRAIVASPSFQLATLDVRKVGEIEPSDLCVRDAGGTERKLSTMRNCTLVHLAWCQPVRDTVVPHCKQLDLLASLLSAHGESMNRVIAFGSAEEYGSSSGQLQENDAGRTILSPYGWGKRAAQTLLETWYILTGKPSLWMRPFLVYGEGQKGNMAIPYAVRQALFRERAEFSAGTQRRDFIHVAEVARAVVLALAPTWKGVNIANIGTGIGTPVREVLEKIAVLYDAADLFDYGVRPIRAGEPEEQIADTVHASNLIGFSAQITIDQGLLRMKKVSQQ
jgi:UDP-glucose 4-epimerase